MAHQNRFQYRKLHPQRVLGWIPNVYNPVSFDIDLFLNSEQKEIYKDVITNNYIFREKHENEIKFSPEKTGLAYRCRIKGIKKLHDRRTYNYNRAMAEIHQFVNDNEGWCFVVISDIDPHRRILVQIETSTPESDYKSVKEILLHHKEKLFQPYRKRNSLNYVLNKQDRYGLIHKNSFYR